MTILLLSAVLLALAIAAVAYRLLGQRTGVLLVGLLIIFGLIGLEAAVVQTIVGRL